MIKIYSNHNKEDIVYSFSMGQAFPDVLGKLQRVEVNGAELQKLIEEKEIPVYEGKTLYLVWNGKQAGRMLKVLKELFIK